MCGANPACLFPAKCVSVMLLNVVVCKQKTRGWCTYSAEATEKKGISYLLFLFSLLDIGGGEDEGLDNRGVKG